MNFGLLGHIADPITRDKFCDNQLRRFGVLIPPILLFSIGIAGRPYNSVSTISCYTVIFLQSRNISYIVQLLIELMHCGPPIKIWGRPWPGLPTLKLSHGLTASKIYENLFTTV